MNILSFDRREETHQGPVNLCKYWWKLKCGHDMPEVMMSDYGFMAFDKDLPVCSVFFYPVMGTQACIWALHVSNPDSTREQRGDAIKELCDYVGDYAKSLGYKILLGYPKMESIKDRMVDNGFIVLEDGAYQCAKILC